MSDKLNEFLDNLQEQIFDEAKKDYGNAGFERWRNPQFNGRMQNYDTHARLKGECGDTMEIYLKFDGNCVESASYFTDGCASSSICGSFTAELAIGKSHDELTEIDAGAVLEKFGRLPEDERHCAFLASATLQEALQIYMSREVKKTTQA